MSSIEGERSGERVRLGVIFGGRSGEHAVSLMSARSVLGALDPNRYEVMEIGISLSGDWYIGDDLLDSFAQGDLDGLTPVTIFPIPSQPRLYALTPSPEMPGLAAVTDLEVIFPVLHGTYGEDGTLQGLLEMAGLAYVGGGVLGSAVGMDKGLFKDVMRAQGIPVLESVVILRSQLESDPERALAVAEAVSPYPLFTKPANLGSSVGVSKCQSRSDLLEGMLEAAQYDRRILVERGLDRPREIEVSVLGNDVPQASVPGEIIPAGDFYSYEAKYHDQRSELLIPAPLPVDTARGIQALATRAFQAIDAAGLARVDFLLDRRDGEVYLNELNTMPGFTQISMYPKLWEASGLTYPELVDRLIQLALERQEDRRRTRFVYQRNS